MKTISSTTESFIREQVTLKFKKLDTLKEKRRLATEKWQDLQHKINELEDQLNNVGELSKRQEVEISNLGEDLVGIIKKVCAKTLASRLKQIGLKMVNEKKTFECILFTSGLFDAIDGTHIVNINYNADKIKKQIQKLESDRVAAHEENVKIDIEIDKLNEKIDKHVKDIVIRLELGGNYDDLMKMINKIKT